MTLALGQAAVLAQCQRAELREIATDPRYVVHIYSMTELVVMRITPGTCFRSILKNWRPIHWMSKNVLWLLFVARSHLHCTCLQRWSTMTGFLTTENDAEPQEKRLFQYPCSHLAVRASILTSWLTKEIKELGREYQTDWKNKLTILDESSAYYNKFIKMLNLRACGKATLVPVKVMQYQIEF